MSCFKRAKRVRDVVVSTVEPKDNNVIWLKPVDDGYTFYINDGIDWNAVNVGGISMSAVESMLAKKAELSGFEAEVNERVLLALKVEGKADKTALDNKASKEDLSNVVTSVSDSLAVFSEQSLGLLDLKVDKVDGKGLSTNDFTNEYKAKIDNLDKQEVSINVDDTLSPTSVNPVQNKVINTALAGKSDINHTHTKSEITDFPELSSVATSGSYEDLSDKPTIPTVPTKLSELENDCGFASDPSSSKSYGITSDDVNTMWISINEYAYYNVINTNPIEIMPVDYISDNPEVWHTLILNVGDVLPESFISPNTTYWENGTAPVIDKTNAIYEIKMRETRTPSGKSNSADYFVGTYKIYLKP